MIERIAELWKRIAAWHHRNAAPLGFGFSPGAAEQEIAELEALIGAELPEDIRASYALHDGLDGGWLLDYGEMLSVKQIVEQVRMYSAWQSDQEWGRGESWRPLLSIEGVKPEWWSPLRVPITDNSGDHLLVDLDPGRGGRYGQILLHSHEMGPEELLAGGFEAWLTHVAEALESGAYYYDEEEQTVLPEE